MRSGLSTYITAITAFAAFWRGNRFHCPALGPKNEVPFKGCAVKSRVENARASKGARRTTGETPALQHPLVRVARRAQCRNNFCDVVRAASFHGDFYRGFAQAYSVVGAVVVGLHYVGAMLGEDSGQAV